MSETPTPALLPTERLAEAKTSIENLNALQRRLCGKSAPLAGYPGTSWSDVVADLLGHIEAREKQVAAELARLLIAPNSEEGWRGRDYWQGVRDTTARITAAASRLGIDPATLSPTS